MTSRFSTSFFPAGMPIYQFSKTGIHANPLAMVESIVFFCILNKQQIYILDRLVKFAFGMLFLAHV